MEPQDLERIRSALYAIPPTDRVTWYQTAFAIMSALGDDGWELWNTWSRQDTRPDHGYNERDAIATWKSARRNQRIGIGTLFHIAKQHGWVGDSTSTIHRDPEDARKRREQQAQEAQRARAKAQEVAQSSQQRIEQATVEPHDYLAAKGMDTHKVLQQNGELLVPAYHFHTGKLQTIQRIYPDGTKKWTYGGNASEAVFRIGTRNVQERWYCEGYATGLSVHDALGKLYRDAQVVVCFSAHNLSKVAKLDHGSPKFVIADHDLFRCKTPECPGQWDWDLEWGPPFCPICNSEDYTEAAGVKYAKETKLPYWMPDGPGNDANDVAASLGIQALANQLRHLLQEI